MLKWQEYCEYLRAPPLNSVECGEEGRDTGLRKGNNTPICFHQYSYLFSYTHLSLDMEKNWCENGGIAVKNKPDYHVL